MMTSSANGMRQGQWSLVMVPPGDAILITSTLPAKSPSTDTAPRIGNAGALFEDGAVLLMLQLAATAVINPVRSMRPQR